MVSQIVLTWEYCFGQREGLGLVPEPEHGHDRADLLAGHGHGRPGAPGCTAAERLG
jgi:hypothetical protein